jgi:hypothetical protein
MWDFSGFVYQDIRFGEEEGPQSGIEIRFSGRGERRSLRAFPSVGLFRPARSGLRTAPEQAAATLPQPVDDVATQQGSQRALQGIHKRQRRPPAGEVEQEQVIESGHGHEGGVQEGGGENSPASISGQNLPELGSESFHDKESLSQKTNQKLKIKNANQKALWGFCFLNF